MSTQALADGSVFANRYRIVRCLARGGMGAVYEVIHLDTKRRRALKAMHGHILHSEELRERFHREARVAAEVESDFIVDVFDTGVDDETGMPFLCMELLRGEELSRRIKRLGRIPDDEVALYLHQTALALDKTHAAGIVHRDLKPENLFVTDREDGPPRVKVLDFGIAKVIADGANSASTTLSIGTPLYMSPEQFTPRARLNGASDVYALGMIAYTCLVGAPYWDEESRVGNVFAFGAIARMGPVEPASERASKRGVTLPAGFDEWFARVSNADPEARFSPATSATRVLAELLGNPVATTRTSLTSPTSGREVSSPGITPIGITPSGNTPSGVTPIGVTPPPGSTPSSMTPVGAARSSSVPAEPRPAAPAAEPEQMMPRLFEDQDDKTLVYANRGAAEAALRALNIELPGMGMTQVIAPQAPAAKPTSSAVTATSAAAPPAVGPPAVALPAVGPPAVALPAVALPAVALPAVGPPNLAAFAGAAAPPVARPGSTAAPTPAPAASRAAALGARASRPLPVVVPPARSPSAPREATIDAQTVAIPGGKRPLAETVTMTARAPAGSPERAPTPVPVVVPPARGSRPSRDVQQPLSRDVLEALRSEAELLEEGATLTTTAPKPADAASPSAEAPTESAPPTESTPLTTSAPSAAAAPVDASPASDDRPPPPPSVKFASLTPSATVLPTPAQRAGSLPDIPIIADPIPPPRRSAGIIIAVIGALLFIGLCWAILGGKRESTMAVGDTASAAGDTTAAAATRPASASPPGPAPAPTPVVTADPTPSATATTSGSPETSSSATATTSSSAAAAPRKGGPIRKKYTQE